MNGDAQHDAAAMPPLAPVKNGDSMSLKQSIRRGISLLACRGAVMLWLFSLASAPAFAQSESAPAVKNDISIADRLLWYVPNRLLDLTDMVRVRLRVGPGWGVSARATDHFHFFGGNYRSAYVGLPGPRYPCRTRAPYGWEAQKGLIWFGVDATDSAAHPPGYSPTEIDVGAHLLFVGAEVGCDVVEIVDFLGGLIFLDPSGDDVELWDPETPKRVQAWRWQIFPTNKPPDFANLTQRLDYVRMNFEVGVNHSTHRIDSLFSTEDDLLMPQPEKSSMRIATFVEVRHEGNPEFTIDTDFDWEVSLPNLERRWSIFVSGEDVGVLPGSAPSDSDHPVFVGIRRGLEDLPIKADAGVRIKLLPEAFTRLRYTPVFDFERGSFSPGLTGLYESDDGLGAIASVSANRWLGQGLHHVVRSAASAKYSERHKRWNLYHGLAYGYVPELIHEGRRGIGGVDSKHIAKGYGVRFGSFANAAGSTTMEKYRLTFAYRKPLHADWIYLQIEPELEWRRDNDWDTVPVLRIGFDALFWGR
jgi:hypothetical protein